MRMIQMIPQIMQNAHDKEALMEMFKTQAEYNWDKFFARLENSDTIDQVVISVAGSMVASHGYRTRSPIIRGLYLFFRLFLMKI